MFQPDRYLLKKQIKENAGFVGGVVLDAGSGGRRYKNFFDFEKYIALDIDSKSNPDIIGSVERIPLHDNSVDSIISTQVLEHVSNPRKAVEEFHRVLKRGGHCLVTAPQSSELHEEPNDYFRFTKFGLEKLFEKSGFETVLIDRCGGFWTLTAQMKIRYLIDLFKLNRRRWLRIIFNPAFFIFGRAAILFDAVDKSEANSKHTLGWLIVAKKQK